MEISRLKKLVVALKGNLAWAIEHTETNPPPAEVHTNANPPKPPSEELVALKAAWDKAVKAYQEAVDAKKPEEEVKPLQSEVDTTHLKYLEERAKEDPEEETTETKTEISSYKEVVGAANEYKAADPTNQAAKKAAVLANSAKTGKLLDAKLAQEQKLVGAMVAGSSGQLKRSLELKIAEMEDEIDQLEKSLTTGPKPPGERIKVITGIQKIKNGDTDEYVPVESEPAVNDYIKSALAPTEVEEADPWTTISFSASAMRSAESSDESSLAVHAEVEVSIGMFSGGASSDVSTASKYVYAGCSQGLWNGVLLTNFVPAG